MSRDYSSDTQPSGICWSLSYLELPGVPQQHPVHVSLGFQAQLGHDHCHTVTLSGC